MVLENTFAIFLLAKNCGLMNVIVNQDNTIGWGEKNSILCPTSVYCKAQKKIGNWKNKTKLRQPPIVCWPLPTPEEPDLCNDFISKEPDYIDCFCITFPQHYVLGYVLLKSNSLNNMDSWKEVLCSSRKPRSVGHRKSKPRKATNQRKINWKSKKTRSVTIQIPKKRRSVKIQTPELEE